MGGFLQAPQSGFEWSSSIVSSTSFGLKPATSIMALSAFLALSRVSMIAS